MQIVGNNVASSIARKSYGEINRVCPRSGLLDLCLPTTYNAFLYRPVQTNYLRMAYSNDKNIAAE